MYVAPSIDSTGFHMPTYNDIRDDLIQDAQSIYGQDIYLKPDSMDYQYISAISQKIYDTLLLAQAVYNSRGPQTSIGPALDSVVKLNGIKRDPATYSTCPVVLTGISGVTIQNAIAQDISGNRWDLPASVTFDTSGNANVTVIAESPGAIAANPGDINTMVTLVYGWYTITNNVAATPGIEVETDGQLRARQATSTAQPSQGLTEGIKGALLALTGVTRAEVYENDTNSTDTNGLPAHSITCVVENGTDSDIANSIYVHKAPGCYTNGTTSVQVTDQYGALKTMRFYRPSYVDIDVVVNVKGFGGYTSATTSLIKSAIAAYLNSLAIGIDLSISSIWGIALSAMPDIKNPLFSITSLTAAKHSQTQGTTDIVTAFNEVTRGNTAYITVNVS